MSYESKILFHPGHRTLPSAERTSVPGHEPAFRSKRAASVVNARRGIDAKFVFTCKGERITRMMTSSWKRARAAVGLDHVRVHDLKHTVGRRLRSAGVSFEDRQDLLGHRSGRITTHYSAAELSKLIDAANRVVRIEGQRPELVALNGALHGPSRKTPASDPKLVAAKNLSA